MKRHSSLKKDLNIYEKQARKPIDIKYSPNYKRTHQSKNFQVVILNPNLRKSVARTQRKLASSTNSVRASYHSELNPEKRIQHMPTSLQAFRSNLNQKLNEHLNLLKLMKSTSQEKEFIFKENRRAKERIHTRQKTQEFQQIQFKRKQRQRDSNVRLRRTTSERSFVLESHKQTISMMKYSRQVRSRSQIRLIKEKHKQTQKQHQYLTIKNKITHMHLTQEQRYQKAFLKNAPLPKYNYPNLNDMLAIASKTISTIKQSKNQPPKKVSSRQKLTSLPKKTTKKKEEILNQKEKKEEKPPKQVQEQPVKEPIQQQQTPEQPLKPEDPKEPEVEVKEQLGTFLTTGQQIQQSASPIKQPLQEEPILIPQTQKPGQKPQNPGQQPQKQE